MYRLNYSWLMADINVTELRQNLPAYLAKVRQGARVRVTSRGKVIAEIVPPSVDEATQAAARARLCGTASCATNGRSILSCPPTSGT
jgi:prevent-host-death family protein